MLITPDIGVEITPEINFSNLQDLAEFGANTAELLHRNGLEFDAKPEHDEIAAQIATAYAADPMGTAKQITPARAATLPPAVLIQTRNILDTFGRAVVKQAIEVRHLVTNKLILESENPDPKVRIRALELLGKISDVGLFTERTEITVTHQSTDDLRTKLREKFNRLKEVEDAEVISPLELELDAELGLND
jgi:hypothetical protein